MEHLSLRPDPAVAADQRPSTREQWEEIAAAVLRKSRALGPDDSDSEVWDRLTLTTLDGVAVTPLGTPELVADLAPTGVPGSAPFTRGRRALSQDGVGDGWDVRTSYADPDAARTHEDALTDLANGASSLWLQLGAAGVAVGDLATVLDEVLLDVAPVVLDAPEDPLGAARAFADLARGTTLAEGTNLGVDPVGAALRSDGGADGAVDLEATLGAAADLAEEIGCLAVVVDGTAVHDLGASDAQELGYVLATGAACLRALVASGRDVAAAAALVEVRLAVTDEQLTSIAKLRAARRAWSRLLELSGVPAPDRAMRQHAVTSRPMMTRYDPWVNMLRTCVAAFAAGVGGADAVTVVPFDAPLGLPDALGRRVARNTSALLVSESHVARVSDPAGGAYVVERLTEDLARAGWAELGRLEESGGVLAALADGSLRARVAEVAEERDRQVARRTRPITGLSEFPNLHETLPERRPWPEGAVPVRSWGHAFETLRDDPPTAPVFLATMGTVAAHTARATFAANLLAAGGVDVVNAGRHDDVAAVLASYTGDDGGQGVVCLTGTDKAYAEWGAELVAALRAAGARWVVLAGKPVEGVEVDDTCATGVDALEFLDRTREKLG